LLGPNASHSAVEVEQPVNATDSASTTGNFPRHERYAGALRMLAMFAISRFIRLVG